MRIILLVTLALSIPAEARRTRAPVSLNKTFKHLYKTHRDVPLTLQNGRTLTVKQLYKEYKKALKVGDKKINAVASVGIAGFGAAVAAGIFVVGTQLEFDRPALLTRLLPFVFAYGAGKGAIAMADDALNEFSQVKDAVQVAKLLMIDAGRRAGLLKKLTAREMASLNREVGVLKKTNAALAVEKHEFLRPIKKIAGSQIREMRRNLETLETQLKNDPTGQPRLQHTRDALGAIKNAKGSGKATQLAKAIHHAIAAKAVLPQELVNLAPSNDQLRLLAHGL